MEFPLEPDPTTCLLNFLLRAKTAWLYDAAMAKSKASPKFSGGRPDKYSKKRSGSVSQSVRATVAENKLLRQAAELERMSINAWCVKTLVAAAKKQIAAAANTQP